MSGKAKDDLSSLSVGLIESSVVDTVTFPYSFALALNLHDFEFIIEAFDYTDSVFVATGNSAMRKAVNESVPCVNLKMSFERIVGGIWADHL